MVLPEIFSKSAARVTIDGVRSFPFAPMFPGVLYFFSATRAFRLRCRPVITNASVKTVGGCRICFAVINAFLYYRRPQRSMWTPAGFRLACVRAHENYLVSRCRQLTLESDEFAFCCSRLHSTVSLTDFPTFSPTGIKHLSPSVYTV